MDNLSKAFTWQKTTKRIAIYCVLLLGLNFVFEFISNEMVFQHNKYQNLQFLFDNKIFRFFYRELIVYTFGYLGFRFFYKTGSKYLAKLFIYFLFLFDFCLGLIGLSHYFFPHNVIFDDIYNYLVTFIASPFYFMAFVIFAVYLNNDKNEQTAE
jgi:hypothetical protein